LALRDALHGVGSFLHTRRGGCLVRGGFGAARPLRMHALVNVLVLAALTEATGNAVTARRIAAHLATAHHVVLVDVVGATTTSVKEIAERERIELAVGVHALLAGPFLRTLSVPYALIFGGTDLYEPMHALQQKQMARAVAGASRLVAFSPENQARAEWMWPSVRGRVELLAQAVDAPLPSTPPSLRAKMGLADDDILFLLPTGIRRVKDPLHVVETFAAWHAVDPRVHLALAGALLEPDYVEMAMPVLRGREGVHFFEALPRPEMLAAIAEADAVLNTSLSEGMCGVILEAMALGTPVLARRNAGNESLVVHGHTGLLYDTPAEAVLWGQALVQSEELGARLARTAQAQIEGRNTPAHERAAYLRIVTEMAASVAPAGASDAPVDELDHTLSVAAQLGFSDATRATLAGVVARVRSDDALAKATKERAGLLATAPPAVAIAALSRAQLERKLGKADARAYLLLLALGEVPAMQARAAARGVSAEVIAHTLSDLVVWAEHLRAVTGTAGLTIELLEWTQRYLRGQLFRLGPLQFDLRPFSGPMRVWRHDAQRTLEARTLDGRHIDLASGTVSRVPPGPLDGDWKVVLEPGAPILEMWIPGAVSMVTLRDVAQAMRDAYALFERLAPETRPVGVCGESWRLDPQVLALFAGEPGVHDLQRACALHPSSLPEARTIRRVFGPDVDRDTIASLPAERMSDTQRRLASLLADRSVRLAARGGFVLREELERMPEWNT
jgi:glycosyltransferase involved in cell wall biosynthesis